MATTQERKKHVHHNARKITRRMLSAILLVGASALPTDAAVIPYDQVVNSMNPIAYWRQEGNGNDSTSNGHNGTVNGTSTFVAGLTLPGITGNQAGSYGSGVITDINVPDADVFSFGDSSTDSPFSLSVWIQPNTTTDPFNGILGKDISGSNREWALLLKGDSTLRMFIKNQGGEPKKCRHDVRGPDRFLDARGGHLRRKFHGCRPQLLDQWLSCGNDQPD